jgi:hypothetical protein
MSTLKVVVLETPSTPFVMEVTARLCKLLDKIMLLINHQLLFPPSKGAGFHEAFDSHVDGLIFFVARHFNVSRPVFRQRCRVASTGNIRKVLA